MTWLHATGVVIRDGRTTDEHPQVREAVQLLYRYAPQWCPAGSVRTLEILPHQVAQAGHRQEAPAEGPRQRLPHPN